jgi:proteic killer suppression protein
MEIEFRDEDLDRLETEADFTAGFDKAIVKAFRKRMQVIRSAKDERDLYAVKGNHFEKLKGNRAHQHSLRLNDQWRLVVEIQSGYPKNTVTVVSIEDYH